MATERENVARIKGLTSLESVVQLWRAVRDQQETPEWDSGKAFEYLLLRAFELEGTPVAWPFGVQMQGQTVEQIDGAIHLGTLSLLVEAKAKSENVNIEPVAKLYSKLLRRPPFVMGVVFSRTGFTVPAKELARFLVPPRVLLWEGVELDHALGRHHGMTDGISLKLRHCAEHGFPDFDIRVGG